MNRIDFLRKNFNVVDCEEIKETYDSMCTEENEVWPEVITLGDDYIFMWYYAAKKKGKRKRLNFLLCDKTFEKILEADPTKQKMYSQWVLNVLVRSIEEGSTLTFTRFINEDIPKMRDNLTLFGKVKRKKRFKEACKTNYSVKHIADCTNLNQYNDFDQLFDAIYPFKERMNVSELEQQLEAYVRLGQAEMPVNDEHCTVYIPLTLGASELFSFTNWCTARKGNGEFKSTIEHHKTHTGENSKLLIFIDKGVFDGKNENLYQLHIETDQFMNKQDRRYEIEDFKKDFLGHSLGLRNFMREYLGEGYIGYRNTNNSGSEKKYYKYIMGCGFGEILFDTLDSEIPIISFKDIAIDKLPSLTRFSRLYGIHLDNVGLKKLNDDIFRVSLLESISVPFNHITELPDNISEAKNLVFMNLAGNPIKEIPESIRFLDKSKGGNLMMVSLNEQNKYLAPKLKEYLPSIEIFGLGN